MSEATTTSLHELAAFTERKRAASLTGRLVGLSLPERDVVLNEVVARFESDLDQARTKAAATGQEVSFDAAAISLTDGGDTWTVLPDGSMKRAYSRYGGFNAFATRLTGLPTIDFSKPIARTELLECAYHGFWAPSATNWQPVRVVELLGDRRDKLARLSGWAEAPADFPMCVLLRREHYESLLGDVLEPFGLEVTAREESIDVGIFSETMRMTAVSRGLTMQEHEFTGDEIAQAREVIDAELQARIAKLQGSDPLVESERRTLEKVLDYLRRGKYIPDALVAIGHPLSPVQPYPAFEKVVAEHSTQRVASPASEFGHNAIMELWSIAQDALPVADRPLVRFADFSWHDQVTSRIGKAMFESLYGQGADPESKSGGEGGILTAITIRNFLLHAAKTLPDYVHGHLPAGWEQEDDSALRKLTRTMPVRTESAGRYLLERILRDGKYVVRDGHVVDTEGNPLTVPLLVRMMKSLASTFGNFFLKFQNTHPQNAVLLVDASTDNPHHAYRSVGRVAALLTYASRAEGASSIIKTGPIDLARDPIGRILAENPDRMPNLDTWKADLESATFLPAMTFQVGMPLTGSDLVDAGTPGEHSGLEERKRDKRPPREDFTWHYLPTL